MNGYGTGITYSQKNDVLTIDKEAHVEMHDADNKVTLDFDADTGVMDRTADLLTLNGNINVLREPVGEWIGVVTIEAGRDEDEVWSKPLKGGKDNAVICRSKICLVAFWRQRAVQQIA